MELKKQIEAILFASGQRMSVDEISRLVRKRNHEPVVGALKELEAEYSARDSPVYLDTDGTTWKLTVRNNFIPVVEKVVSDIELNKSVIETLAVIAWHYPILQSDVISIRTNKAYDHLNYLEEQGFISREKYGRTNKIRLTDKFSQYFELPKGQEKEAFRAALPDELKKRLEEREKKIIENERIIEEEVEKQESEKAKSEAKKEIDSAILEAANVEVHVIDEKGKEEKLDTYDSKKEGPKVEVYEEPSSPKTEVVESSGEQEETSDEQESQEPETTEEDFTVEEDQEQEEKETQEKTEKESQESGSEELQPEEPEKSEEEKEEEVMDQMMHPKKEVEEPSISPELEAMEKKAEEDERKKAEEEKKKLLTGADEDVLETEDENANS